MKQQWHPVVYFHKQVSYLTFLNFWLLSELFFFCNRFSRNLLPPTHTIRTATDSYRTPQARVPVMETKMHKCKRSAFSKAIHRICICKNLKLLLRSCNVDRKTFLNYSQKNKGYFSPRVHKSAANIILYCSPLQSPCPFCFSPRQYVHFFLI